MTQPEDRREPVDPRVPLALERTFLAWVRTALAMMGFGFVVARFGLFLRELTRVRGVAVPPPQGISALLGISLVILGVATAAFAAYRLRSGMRSIDEGLPPLSRSAAVPTLITIVLIAIGVAAVIHLTLMR